MADHDALLGISPNDHGGIDVEQRLIRTPGPDEVPSPNHDHDRVRIILYTVQGASRISSPTEVIKVRWERCRMVFAGLLTLPEAGPVGGLAALLADQGVLGVIALRWVLSLGYVLLGLAGLLVLFGIYLIVLQPASGH